MTSSWEYNNILFYAVGNEIYKLDFSTGQTTLIYSHPDASAEFVDLKMGVEGIGVFSLTPAGVLNVKRYGIGVVSELDKPR